MSDYVHNKVVRLPFPKQIFEKCNTDDTFECEDYLKELLGNLWGTRNSNGFEIGYSDDGYYIDWLYHHTYGENSGDWGNVRLLTPKELEVIKPYFDKLKVPYTDNELRLVDYCYYNGCEPSDYYELATEAGDDSHLFTSKPT
tara:strand:- start:512 stop:937 length:426 start_codon:yes stop_codon:yes gene_type:complete